MIFTLSDIYKYQKPAEYKLLLLKPDLEPIGYLEGILDMDFDYKMESYDTLDIQLSYTVPDSRTHRFTKNPYWDLIKGDYIIEAIRCLDGETENTERQRFLIVDSKIDTDNKQVKNLQCFSLEYELAYKNIRDFKSVSDDDVEIETRRTLPDIISGLLHDKMADSWRLGYVDGDVACEYRGYDVSDSNLYDFFTDLQKLFRCVFRYDTINRIINVYDITVYNLCPLCGKDTLYYDLSTLRCKNPDCGTQWDTGKTISILAKYDSRNYATSTMLDIPANSCEFTMPSGEYTLTQVQYGGVLMSEGTDYTKKIAGTTLTVTKLQKPFSKQIYGRDSGLYITEKNYIKKFGQEIDQRQVTSRLYVYGKDNMSVRELNFGQPYLTDYSFYRNDSYMSPALRDVLDAYDSYAADKNTQFMTLNKELLSLRTKYSQLAIAKPENKSILDELQIRIDGGWKYTSGENPITIADITVGNQVYYTGTDKAPSGIYTVKSVNTTNQTIEIITSLPTESVETTVTIPLSAIGRTYINGIRENEDDYLILVNDLQKDYSVKIVDVEGLQNDSVHLIEQVNTANKTVTIKKAAEGQTITGSVTIHVKHVTAYRKKAGDPWITAHFQEVQNALDKSITEFQNKITIISEDQIDDYSLSDLKEAQKIYAARIQALIELENGSHDPDHNPELDLEQSSTWHKGDIFTFEATKDNKPVLAQSTPLESDSTTVKIPDTILSVPFWNLHFYVRLNGTLQSVDYQYTLDLTNNQITKKSVNLNEFKQMLDRMAAAKQEEVDRLAVYDGDNKLTGGLIYDKLQEIEAYGKQVNFEEWLTRSKPDGYGASKEQAKLLCGELNQYTKEQVYTNNDIGVADLNEDIGSVEYYDAMQSLLKAGRNAFASMWQPPVQFDVDLIDFLSCLQCQDDWDRFSLGDIVHIRHSIAEQPDFTVRLVGIKYNPLRNDLSGEFSNQDNLKTDDAFALELFKNAKTASITVSNNKGQWSNAEQNAVDTIRGGIIDTAKQRISGANDGVVIDSRGITVSSKLKAYEDYQTRISAGVICTTEKNGQIIKSAMVNGDLVAERIVGTQLVGNQLTIAANKYDASGEKGIMTMLVNGDGVKLSNGGLTIEDKKDIFGKSTGNGISLTPDGGLVVTCVKDDSEKNKTNITAKFNAADGILIERDGKPCFSFDNASNDLLVDGLIYCKDLYLGGNTESVLTTINKVTKIKGGVIYPDGIEMKTEAGKNIFSVTIAKSDSIIELGDYASGKGAAVAEDGTFKMGNKVSFSWGADNSPVCVLYARSSLAKPTGKYADYPDTSTTGWHKTFDPKYDQFARYSYDGGESWTASVQIIGKDGVNGSDAHVPEYIQSTYIDSTTIKSPTIRGGTIVGGTFIANSNPNAKIENNDTPGYVRMLMNQNGIECKNSSDKLDGIRLTANNGFGKLEFYYDNEYRGELSQSAGTLFLDASQMLYIGCRNPPQGSVGLTKAVGKWDFSDTTQLTGIRATFA